MSRRRGVGRRARTASRVPVTREGDHRLPDHTIFRPTNLAQPDYKRPIVVWANGGCRASNEEFRYFLMNFASYGYFIVANGAPETLHPNSAGHRQVAVRLIETLESLAGLQPGVTR